MFTTLLRDRLHIGIWNIVDWAKISDISMSMYEQRNHDEEQSTINKTYLNQSEIEKKFSRNFI